MTHGIDGHAEDDGRVYQAGGDQHINEHHHYSPPPAPSGPDSVRRPTVGRAPVILRDRQEVLTRLQAAITSQHRGEVYVLHGMGGCGKTALAHALFQYATNQGHRIGLWVNAADRASLRAGMLAVAADRGAADGELLAARNGLRPAADLVWEHLDNSHAPWLLVLDNADDPTILKDGHWLRTSPQGTTIVTTRRAAPRWWPGAELQHIGVLPREDAARVLHDLAPHSGTLKHAAEVADRLGRLPLALTLAGGFLSHQVIDPWSMETYGHHLDQGHIDLIDRGADPFDDEDPRHLVGRTWQLTLDAFDARGLPEAAALLRLLARLAPEPLPLTLLNRPEINSILPPARSETALRALLDHSLTELVDVGILCAKSHRILLDSVAAATPPEALTTLNATAAQLLNAAIPDVPDAGPYDAQLRLLAPHALALLRRSKEEPAAPDVLALTTRLAIALHRTGDYLSAWETLRDATAIAEEPLGLQHRLVLRAKSRAGRALFRLGRYAESETLLRRVRSTQEQVFGTNDPDTLDTCQGLQLLLNNLGRREEALTLLRSTVAARQAVLGPWHPLTLRSRASLLVLLPPDELTAEGPETPLSLPEECALHLGPDHTVTLGARHNHAWALYVLERFDEAEEQISRVVQEYRSRFGPDYPITLSARQLHARIQAALGNLPTAIELMTDVLSSRERSLGEGHPFTAAARALLNELHEKANMPPHTSQ